MATVSEKFAQHYLARREMSNPADMARLLVARLYYPVETRLPASVNDLVRSLESGDLTGTTGKRRAEFAAWLRDDFITLGRRTRGTSYYPIHPLLSRPLNREEPRTEGFILTLAKSFSVGERRRLYEALWGSLPPFEEAVHDLVEWQLSGVADVTENDRATAVDATGLTAAAAEIIRQTREDLLSLATETVGVQTFTDHAGRLLSLALARFFLAQADVELALPIYIAPAADSHDGVRALAHEVIEIHRVHFERALKKHFMAFYREAVLDEGAEPDLWDAAGARQLTQRIFHYNANVVPLPQYTELREEHGDLCAVSYHYYWRRSGASSRFLRQLHAAQLNLAKKAGIANSRSQYSSWHYYWLAPSLVETLLLVRRPQLGRDRMLVVELLRDWRKRYGLALLIDSSWEEIYQSNFRGLGNPEALNEANLRRFNEILAERGRLHKNSDDFPWVVLRD